MNHTINDLSGDAIFQLRVRQAILAAQHSIKQVGLLIIDFAVPGVSLDRQQRELLIDQAWIRLRRSLRDSDTIVRMDSGDLAVLLPSITGSEDVLLVARKLLDRLGEPLVVGENRLEIQPRIGIALFPEHSSSANALIQRADAALHDAKTNHKDYVVYTEPQTDGQRSPLRMSELRQAIVEDQLFLLYQPKIDLKTGAISGVEVLTRWQHPQLGLIPPDEFIPVAERTGLIIPLTLWVMHQALLQWHAWNQKGIDLHVAVNLSMWNLEAVELPDQIKGLLASVGIPPERLELEITESAIMGDPQRAMRTLSAVRDLGVRFTIDDFGTGYSSLAHLRKLPVAGMKIDKSFVQNMEGDRDNAVIVRSIIDLGHNLGLSVVAEGVETREAKEMLTEFGCDAAQGFYFSRPLPAQEIFRIITPAVSANGKPAGSGRASSGAKYAKDGRLPA